MAVRRLAEAHLQPKEFAFTADNLAWARREITKYPEGRQASAVIPILWRAQEQSGGWVPEAAIRAVADLLGMAYIRVLEIATFYTMFNLAPIGRFHVQLCGTTPCMLRGAGELIDVCHNRIGEQFDVTADGALSWVEVECLGACVNAPMAQINYDFYEDLTPESFSRILDDLAAGKDVKPGPQIDRQLSAPVGGPTTLTDPSLYAQANGGTPQPGTHTHSGPAAVDDEAKKPGDPASRREEPVPKPPEGDASKDQQTGRRE
jgi:NADH-quinone oxidoreductase subunit E